MILDFNEWDKINEGKKKGMWDNIHAKRKRGESPAKPGDDDYPSKEAWKENTSEDSTTTEDEIEMASQQLTETVQNIEKVISCMGSMNELPAWAQDKISVVNSHMEALADWCTATNSSLNESAGIPDRYKKKGYSKVGAKKINKGSGNHKWSVLAKKKVGGEMKYKIVKGGYKGMDDYSQHKDAKRKKAFWDRMGGKNSAKAKDPFSALYWHKRFGTW